jgi:hypothetical protein
MAVAKPKVKVAKVGNTLNSVYIAVPVGSLNAANPTWEVLVDLQDGNYLSSDDRMGLFDVVDGLPEDQQLAPVYDVFKVTLTREGTITRSKTIFTEAD